MDLEKTAARLYRGARSFIEERRRRRIAFQHREGRAARPTIYFLVPDFKRPSGGTMVMYRHVDILNAAGLKASVVHSRPGFRCSWFANGTEVIDLGRAVLRDGDVVVVPELGVDVLPRLPAGVRRVVFNQNSHLTWTRPVGEVRSAYEGERDLSAVAVVSEHNEAMLRRCFPATPIRRVHLSIDPTRFHPGTGERPRRIAYMPRRGGDDAHQVLSLLKARKSLEGWELVALDGLSHEAVADALRHTRIFLAFTSQEGFGLPAAEAMACGCYVVGNHGFGGREFLLPAFAAPVDNGDILGFVDAIDVALAGEAADPDWCRRRGEKAADFILSRYTPKRERDDVVSLYSGVCA